MYETLAVVALFVLVYSSVAGAVERTWISGPIVFTCFGLLTGPRGLASIVFTVMVVNSGLPASGPLVMTVACTIMLSIIGHGLSADPWARAYGERRKLVAGKRHPSG
jgi:NhaP-type Na+/H+ or K+/H+ antiporter